MDKAIDNNNNIMEEEISLNDRLLIECILSRCGDSVGFFESINHIVSSVSTSVHEENVLRNRIIDLMNKIRTLEKGNDQLLQDFYNKIYNPK